MQFDFKKLKRDHRIMQYMLDFVVKEDVCNLSCEYCLCTFSEQSASNIKKVLSGLAYKEGNALKTSIDAALKNYNTYFDSPILKISGGEILLVDNVIALVESASKNFETVQILTNGSLLNNNLIKKLKKIPNLHIQLSLDGHLYSMNKNRFKSKAQNDAILKHLDVLIENDIVTEIFCVVTKDNINELCDFAAYLSKSYKDKVILFPFPVRQKAAEVFFPLEEQLIGFELLIKDYGLYPSVLPPRIYLEKVYEYMQNQKRCDSCFVPLVSSQMFDDGRMTPCLNCWTIESGNMIHEAKELYDHYGEHSIYNLMTKYPIRMPMCKGCFSEMDIVNLYFNGMLTMEELQFRPLYRSKRTKEQLKQLKEILNG